MEITLKGTQDLSQQEIMDINYVASRGFGGLDPNDMIADTARHIAAADAVQQAREADVLQAFALYRPCLWRTGN